MLLSGGSVPISRSFPLTMVAGNAKAPSTRQVPICCGRPPHRRMLRRRPDPVLASKPALRHARTQRSCAAQPLMEPVLTSTDASAKKKAALDQSPTSGNRIKDFLANKHIFVTGSTGFCAKVFVEKLLREQPNIGGLYLLIRARDGKTAQQRLDELLSASLFDGLRLKMEPSQWETLKNKIHAVEGDMTLDQGGLEDGTRKHLQATINVVVNAAASTSFDECYECALKVNALSAQATAELAASCEHLDCLVHVSTAYTGANLNLEGMVPEQLHGYALNGGNGSGNGSGQSKVPHSADTFSVAEEVDLTLRARASGASDEDNKQLGITRARELGYLDTYTLTKSMGEMLVSQVARKARIPTAIIRPSIVEGTWEEPIPGWIEGNKSADPIITLYGRGQIPGFPFKSPESVLDFIPVDFVSRAMVAAIWSAASQDPDAGSTPRIYHVSSSGTQNPMTMGMFAEGVSKAFQQQPVKKSESPAQPFRLFPEPRQFLAGFESESKSVSIQARAQQLKKMVEIYQPYTMRTMRFSGRTVEQLNNSLQPDEQAMCGLDFGKIDWIHYISNVHIPGLRKHVFKDRW